MNGAGPYTLPTLRQSGDLVLLKVRAQPAASREGIRGLHADALKVAVHASPEKGKANAAIEKVVAKALGLRASQVRVESGATCRDKWLRLEGLCLDEARRRLACVTGGAPEASQASGDGRRRGKARPGRDNQDKRKEAQQ